MNGFSRVAFSLRPTPQNIHCIDWGPDGYIAIASEQFVYVYKLQDTSFDLIRTISKHRSNITVVRFSSGTVNLAHPNAFQLFLAVGDESGNCLIYDVFTGARHSGFSPEKSTNIQVCDIQWPPSNPSIVYVMTSQPCVLCLTNGSVRLRRYSELASWSSHGLPYQYFNMKYLYSVSIQNRCDFMCLDPFAPSNVFVCSRNGIYQIIRENVGSSTTVSQPAKIPGMTNEELLLNVEFFPHAENRIVGILPSRIVLYDLSEKTGAIVIRNHMTQCCCASKVFNASENDVFWLPLTDGSVARIQLKEGNEKWTKKSHIGTNVGLQKMMCFAADPYHPTRAAIYSRDGSLCVLQEIGEKLFVKAMIPVLGNQIVGWHTESERLAFLTDKGYVAVVYKNGDMLRFAVDDQGYESITFAGSDQLVVGANRLHKIDLVKRKVEQDRKQITPRKLVAEGQVYAYTPLPDLLEIVFSETEKRSVSFCDTIRAFACKIGDPWKWAVIVSGSGLCVIDVSTDKPSQKRFAVKERVTLVVFSCEKVVMASEAGDVVLIDMETSNTISRRISVCPINSLKYSEGSLLVVTSDFDFFFLDTNDLHTTKQVRWKVMDAGFLSKEFTVVKTSLSSLRILTLPNFESLSSGTAQKGIRGKFIQTENINELESLALAVGDLDFVRFVRIIQNKGSLPVPSTYSLAKLDFIQKQELTLRIEKAQKRNAFIEFLILTGKTEEAAETLIKDGNEDDLLFAYACLAPNSSAAKRLLTITKGDYSPLIAKMLVISGDHLSAISLLSESGDRTISFKYARALLTNTDYTTFLSSFISDSPILLRSPELRALVGDSYGCLSLLHHLGDTTKAYVYLRYLETQNIQLVSTFGANVDASLADDVRAQWEAAQATDEP